MKRRCKNEVAVHDLNPDRDSQKQAYQRYWRWQSDSLRLQKLTLQTPRFTGRAGDGIAEASEMLLALQQQGLWRCPVVSDQVPVYALAGLTLLLLARSLITLTR